MRIRSVLKHSGQAVLEGALIATLVVGLMAGTTFAAKPIRDTSGGSGACAVNPSPVAVAADYTLTGTGLGAYALVNILISDSGNVSSWNLQADANGTTSLVWHSYWSGTSNVKFMKSGRHGATQVAGCSFSVN
jgi:hypothetical protein